MRQTNLDLDALRSFVTGVELGTFARAADRLGRSTSAVSAQLKKLEDQVGIRIFRKAGRGLALTDRGETLLAYARRLLDLNDEAMNAVQGAELEGWVRLGLQEDFGEAILPRVLGRFARAHPKVRIEGRVARNAELVEKIMSGRLDLALAWDGGATGVHADRIANIPLCWIGSAEEPLPWASGNGDALPLLALEAPCLFRTIACEQLDRHGISWRLAFSSPSLAGVWPAAAAGLGITVRPPIGLPKGVQVLNADSLGLPALPSFGLLLLRAKHEADPIAAHLATIILQALRETMADEWIVRS
jgi:DNA-binding transcriptional LysR family regulator